MLLDHHANATSRVNQMSFHASNLNITQESLMGHLFIAYVSHITYTICNVFHHQHVYACVVFCVWGNLSKFGCTYLVSTIRALLLSMKHAASRLILKDMS